MQSRKNYKRVIVKVGSSLFTPLEAGHRRCPTAAYGSLPLTGSSAGKNKLDTALINSIGSQISDLIGQGKDCLLYTSPSPRD